MVDSWSTPHLPPAETTLLMALRLWVGARRRGNDGGAEIDRVLTLLGCGDAGSEIEAFMGSLAVPGAVHRPILVACICDRRVTPDEKRLLQAIALQQRGRSLEAMITLRGLLRHEAALEAQAAAGRIARRLTKADQRLLVPDAAIRLEALAGEGHGAPGDATLH